MIKLLVSDLDGTLFEDENNEVIIKEENIKLLQEYHRKGGMVALATGRGKDYTDWVSNKLGFPCFDIAVNGSSHALTKEVKHLEKDVLKEIIKRLRKSKMNYYFLISPYQGNLYYPLMYNLKNNIKLHKQRKEKPVNKIGKEKFSFFKFNHLINSNKTCKIVIFFDEEKDKNDFYNSLKDLENNLTIYQRSKSLEINGREVSKGNALLNLVKQLKLNKEEVMVIGDGVNDLSMLEKFPNSFTFQSSKEEIKKVAKFIIIEFNEIKEYLF